MKPTPDAIRSASRIQSHRAYYIVLCFQSPIEPILICCDQSVLVRAEDQGNEALRGLLYIAKISI